MSDWAAIYLAVYLGSAIELCACTYLIRWEHERWALALFLFSSLSVHIAGCRLKKLKPENEP